MVLGALCFVRGARAQCPVLGAWCVLGAGCLVPGCFAVARRSRDASEGGRSRRMIGRVFDRRATSLKPALRNADGIPVHTNGSGVRAIVGSTGYPSTISAPCFIAISAAARRRPAETPRWRYGRATNRQEIDQTGCSSTSSTPVNAPAPGNPRAGRRRTIRSVRHGNTRAPRVCGPFPRSVSALAGSLPPCPLPTRCARGATPCTSSRRKRRARRRASRRPPNVTPSQAGTSRSIRRGCPACG